MLLLLLACAPTIPAALEVEPAADVADLPEPADSTARIAWMIGSDPLARRPRTPAGGDDPALAAWRAVAMSNAPTPYDWGALEAAHPGTVAVPLARGARLAALETALGDPAQAMAWVLPLPSPAPTQDQVRPPLDWFGGGPPEGLLNIVEREVVLGWLDGPAIPTDAVARALSAPTYDRVAATPAGKLLVARGARPVDATARAEGRAALEDATWLAAMGAAADRDTEQAQFKALRADAATKAGVTGDPVKALLARAADRLAADAGTDASVGLALLAQAALRWEGGCPDAPCGGFDRVVAMNAAGRWDPSVAPLAAAWRAIAFKDAADRLEVAYDQVSFPQALDEMTEALLGTGAAMDRSVLLYPRPGAPVQLALSRAAGGGDLTTRDDMFHTIDRRLVTLAQEAGATAPERLREPLARMAKRAGG